MPSHKPDPAGEFAAAMSLYDHILASHSVEEITDNHEGQENVMRSVMTLAKAFESWACRHVDFEKLQDRWSYVLEDGFGAAAFQVWDGSGHDLLDGLIGCESEIAQILQLPILPTPSSA
jgi:hypothetical protein